MINKILIILFCTLINPAYAGIDQEFTGNKTWLTNLQKSYFGVEKSYAFVVGVGQYNDKSLASLPSEKDAIKIKNYLINEAGFDSVRLLTGDKVTLDKVRYYMLDYYSKELKSNDRFLFYWSGHGVTKGKPNRKLGYLTLKNSTIDNASSMLSMNNISLWDVGIKAKQTLYLLDSCFSGIAASKSMSIRGEQTIQRINRPSRQILTAGMENQQTLAINDLGGGVFTRALLDGLRGHADTDKGPFKKDGIVTIHELEEYVRERVDHERRRVKWNNLITPQLYNLSESEGDFFFVSDKRILKKPQNLIKRQSSTFIQTGIDADVSMMKSKRKRVKYKKERYINKSNGTIHDTKTGRLWKRCSEGQTGNECSGTAKEYTWDEAIKYFNPRTFAGYNDWHIPTVEEITSLRFCRNNKEAWSPSKTKIFGCDINYGKNSYNIPTIDSSFFPNVAPLGNSNDKGAYLFNRPCYWTKTHNPGSSGSMMVTCFGEMGGTSATHKTYKNRVLLVRKNKT